MLRYSPAGSHSVRRNACSTQAAVLPRSRWQRPEAKRVSVLTDPIVFGTAHGAALST